MKSIIQSICLFSVVFTSLFIQSCKKDDGDNGGGGSKDPCENTVEVIALEEFMYPTVGHFELLMNFSGNSFTVSQTYLRIVNWDDYSSRVVPGRKYKIAYEEVECNDPGTCGDDKSSRCGMPILKCARILCLKECPNEGNKDCFNSEFYSEDLSGIYSRVTAVEAIVGKQLKASSYFSGCSQEDPVQFRLIFAPSSEIVDGREVVEAKVEEIDRGIVCQAVFQKDICFDLSAIDQHYMLRNSAPAPESVLLRVYVGDVATDLIYNLQ